MGDELMWKILLFFLQKIAHSLRRATDTMSMGFAVLHTHFTLAAAAVLVIGVMISLILFLKLVVHLNEIGIVLGIGGVIGIAYALHCWGCLENARYIHCVPMKSVQLTLRGEELEKLEAEQLAVLKWFRAETFDTFKDKNLKLAKAWGPGSLARASPTRAVPVLLDTFRPGECYWALENNGAIRYSLQGYSDVRIQIVSPDSANPAIALVHQRWQDLRVRAAQSRFRELAKRLRVFEMGFEFPKDTDDGISARLEVYFRRSSESAPSRRKEKKTIAEEKSYTIADLERLFEGWVQDCQGVEADRLAAEVQRREAERKEAAKPVVRAPPKERVKRASSPRCKKGHPLKPHKKQIMTTCDECSEEIRKNTVILVCSENSCPYQVCNRCEPLPKKGGEEGICVACLEVHADLVYQFCGHLVYCKPCGRKTILRQANVALNKVNAAMCEKTLTVCPICRHKSGMMDRYKYNQRIFEQ